MRTVGLTFDQEPTAAEKKAAEEAKKAEPTAAEKKAAEEAQ